MKYLRAWQANIATAAAVAQGLLLVACQAGLGGATAQPAPPKNAFFSEFKKIDTAGKGRVTMEQAYAYYRGRFIELDKNGDGFLDASELEAMLPAMDATSGKELVAKLDRNSDGKISQEEFGVIANWLFQLARSQNEITLADVEKR